MSNQIFIPLGLSLITKATTKSWPYLRSLALITEHSSIVQKGNVEWAWELLKLKPQYLLCELLKKFIVLLPELNCIFNKTQCQFNYYRQATDFKAFQKWVAFSRLCEGYLEKVSQQTMVFIWARGCGLVQGFPTWGTRPPGETREVSNEWYLGYIYISWGTQLRLGGTQKQNGWESLV
jgi:hypothetical protein